MLSSVRFHCSLHANFLYFNSKGPKNQLIFSADDIKIVEKATKQGSGVMVGFVVLYSDGTSTSVMPKKFVHDFIVRSGDELAGYKVTKIGDEIEGAPAGHHSKPQSKSKTKYIVIGVGVAAGLIAVIALVFVVKRLVS